MPGHYYIQQLFLLCSLLLMVTGRLWLSVLLCLLFDMIRPALTNYFSNIAGDRQGFAGGLNSTFTSMGISSVHLQQVHYSILT